MIPAHFIKVETFPKTASGKVDRKALAKSHLDKIQSLIESKGKEPRTVAQILRSIWKGILQVEDFTPESNFFNLGGRSILAQKLSLEISEKLGVRFPVAYAYQYPTLASQLKYLSGKSKLAENEAPSQVDSKQSRHSKDVAVIAMAGKFPKANTVGEFWEMIKNKQEGISFFDIEEIDPLIRAEAEQPNYVKARGIVEGVENFDAEFFGMNPKLAAIMDPQQRLFMEICHEALEKAGWIADRPEFKIGVFGGTNYNSFFNKNIVFDQELLDVFGSISIASLNEKDYLTSRTAFQLNLKGPAVSVYSACSTSLLAVAQAVESIRKGECIAALAGGSSVTFPVRSGQVHEQGAIFSVDGHCKPFDASSTGTLFCDGAGVVLLKSYDQAVADGDTVFAVIKGVAVNNDGSEKANFTSPSVLGQADVIKSAMDDANVEAAEIGLIEAHGTATPIGDPIEIEGLKLAFGENVPSQTCSVSSVKSNIGHLTAAAGIAGLIKAVCALHEKVLPASLGYENPNPEIDFDNSPFYVQKETTPWTSDRKRIAGVSSFGFGGTNVHVVVEEFIPPVPAPSADLPSGNLVTFSAKTEKSLSLYAEQLLRFVQDRPTLDLSRLSQNLLKRTAPYEMQQALAFSSRDKLLDLLQKVSKGELKPVQRLGAFTFPIFLFPGQGSQYVGMGKSFYESNRIFKAAFDRCCEEFDQYLPTSLKVEIFEGTAETLANTRYTQPAIFTVSYSMALALQDMGIQPAAFCGHSIGEYVGAHLAGIFSLEDAILVVAHRAKLISELQGGNMLSVRSKADIIQELLPDQLSIAAHNAPNICVVSGPVEAVAEFSSVLDEYGIASQLLKTSHAFHSTMMDGALDKFSKVVGSVTRNFPKVPVMSTQTGKWLTDEEAQSVEYWTNQIRNSVLFSDAAAALLRELPEGFFLEVGPGNVLSSLIQQQPESKKSPVAHSLSRDNIRCESDHLLEQLGTASAKGASIDLQKVLGYSDFEFIDIPTYAFDKKLCWNQDGALANPYFHKKGRRIVGPTEVAIEAVLAADSVDAFSGVHRHFSKLREMLESASGVLITENDLESSFFELGLDSLILTQLTFSLKKEFGVEISFRQLNGTHNTPKSVLDLLDDCLPINGVDVPSLQQQKPVPFEKEQVNGKWHGLSKVEPAGLSTAQEEYFIRIRKMLEKASGVIITEKDLNSSFFELGLDSLNLTQFIFSLKKEIDIPISFRQLNDTLNTPKALLDYFAPCQPTVAESDKTFASGKVEMDTADATGSISLLKQQLAEVAKNANGKNGHSENGKSIHVNFHQPIQKISTPISTDLTPAFEDSISETARQFLSVLNEEYSKKTAKSKASSRRQYTSVRPAKSDSRTSYLDDLSYSLVADRLNGTRMVDLDRNEYLNWMGINGSNLFGSNPAWATEALRKQLDAGIGAGSMNAQVEEIKELLNTLTGIDQFGIYASESEAKQHAIRLAKTASSRTLIVHFTDRVSATPTTTNFLADGDLVLAYGAKSSLDLIAEFSGKIAAVFVAPIHSNDPADLPVAFLKELRAITEIAGICLIVDEALTGFRVHPGGIQQLIDVHADMTMYGPIDGAGSLTILGGSPKWIKSLTELTGEVSATALQYSNYCNHGVTNISPLSLTIAKAYLKEVLQHSPDLQEKLAEKTDQLISKMNQTFAQFKCPYQAVSFRSIWKIKAKSAFPFWETLFTMLRQEGVFIEEGELCFMTQAHTTKDINFTINALESVLEKLIENELVNGDLPDMQEVLMDIKRPPFPGAKIGFDAEGNPIWIKPLKK